MKAMRNTFRPKVRLILALCLALAVLGLSVAVPLTAAANHGEPHGGGNDGGSGGNSGSTKLLLPGTGTEVDYNSPHLPGCNFIIQWSGFPTGQTTVYFMLTGTGSDSDVEVYGQTEASLSAGSGTFPIEFNPTNLADLTPHPTQGYHISLMGDVTDETTNGKNKTFKIEKACGQPSLGIEKTATPTALLVDQQTVFTINVWNPGDGDAENVTISDPLPAGLTYVDDNKTECNESPAGTVSCDVGTLLANGDAETNNFDVQVTVLATTAGTKLNTATVDADDLDPLTNDATVTVTEPDPDPDPTPTITPDPDPTPTITPDPDPSPTITPTPTTTPTQPAPPGPGPVVTDDNGTLIVEKQTLPDGATETFSFSGAVSATLGDGQSSARSVDPGTYTVTEATANGWSLSSITCTDSNTSGQASTGDLASKTATFQVSANETVRCVFTNSEDEVLPEPPVEEPEDEVLPKPPVTQPKDEVLPKQQVKSGALPFTGTDPYGLMSLAGLLITTGGSLVLINRRRKY